MLFLLIVQNYSAAQSELTASSDIIHVRMEEEQPPATTLIYLPSGTPMRHHNVNKGDKYRYINNDYNSLGDTTIYLLLKKNYIIFQKYFFVQ